MCCANCRLPADRGRRQVSGSFLKKKNQKTFAQLASLYSEGPQPKQSQVFCFFFSKKEGLLFTMVNAATSWCRALTCPVYCK
jgi:hypothetical protein